MRRKTKGGRASNERLRVRPLALGRPRPCQGVGLANPLAFPSGSWRSSVRTMREHDHGERHFGAAAQAGRWDARYRERDGAMCSGRPNGRLVAEVAALAPGRVLDVGCGEGADAIWLAQRGWTVTAIDISEVAICRAREASVPTGASVEWICGDVLQTPFPARSFELVSMQYPALPKAAGEGAV